MDFALTTAGWIGGGLALLAYALLLMERLSPAGLWFNALNTLSGILLMGSAAAAGALPNLVFNFIWAAWGIYGLANRQESAECGSATP